MKITIDLDRMPAGEALTASSEIQTAGAGEDGGMGPVEFAAPGASHSDAGDVGEDAGGPPEWLLESVARSEAAGSETQGDTAYEAGDGEDTGGGPAGLE